MCGGVCAHVDGSVCAHVCVCIILFIRTFSSTLAAVLIRLIGQYLEMCVCVCTWVFGCEHARVCLCVCVRERDMNIPVDSQFDTGME
jgi:hypothetical protein